MHIVWLGSQKAHILQAPVWLLGKCCNESSEISFPIQQQGRGERGKVKKDCPAVSSHSAAGRPLSTHHSQGPLGGPLQVTRRSKPGLQHKINVWRRLWFIIPVKPQHSPPFSPELEAAVVFLGFAGHFFLRVTVTTNYHSNSLSKLPILVMMSAGSRNTHPFLIFYILGLLTASW